MKIIPAIDIIDGKCVRLSMGDYDQKIIYDEDPVEVAKRFEDHGIKYLHLVDLDGARSKRIINHKVLERISSSTSLCIDFGGGVKSNADIQLAFDSGAQKVTGGSIAMQDPELFASWLEDYGPDRIILGADCKDRMIATNGWLQTTSMDVVDFIVKFLDKGGLEVVCTDISKDGMLQGPSIDLYKEILSSTSAALIASGGVSTLDDLHVLKRIGCSGAIIGKAIYEDRITLNELASLC
jgi:phosphoribosylformimino-5-aminoimidazole carboxamide ribotide isomerase